MTFPLDSTGAAAVDQNYFWQPIETCPRNVKVQLIVKKIGVAVYGKYTSSDAYYTHWAALPKFKKEVNHGT